MNTLDIINKNLDDIEIARLDAQERMRKGEARRRVLNDAFDRAVVRPENVDSAGVVNWNFVEADLYLDDLDPTEGEFATMVWMWEQSEMRRLGIK